MAYAGTIINRNKFEYFGTEGILNVDTNKSNNNINLFLKREVGMAFFSELDIDDFKRLFETKITQRENDFVWRSFKLNARPILCEKSDFVAETIIPFYEDDNEVYKRIYRNLAMQCIYHNERLFEKLFDVRSQKTSMSCIIYSAKLTPIAIELLSR